MSNISNEVINKIINGAVRKFIHRYGGDEHELTSAAGLTCIHALNSFKEGKIPKTAWIYHKVWYALKEVKRTTHRHTIGVNRIHLDFTLLSDKQLVEFDADTILEKLSPNAKFVLKLAITPNRQIRDLTSDYITGTETTNLRRALKKYLAEDLSWPWLEIETVFEEVRKAL